VTTTFLIFLVILVWFRQGIGTFLAFRLAGFFDWWEKRRR
jgi:hypothetical protein